MNNNYWMVTELAETDGLILGITTDNDDNIYFTTGYRGLWKLNKNLEIECLVERDGKTYMMGLVWNGLNTLYICDYMHGIVCYHLRTKKFIILADEEGHQDGELSTARFYRPWGIAMDRNGILYVSEKLCVRKINLEERIVSTLAGTFPDTVAETELNPVFENLTGIAVKDDIVYVCDNGNSCIIQITQDGVVSLVAGNPGRIGFQDGTLSDALFTNPHGLLLDSNGFLLVADRSALRRVDIAHNKVSTFALNLVKEVWTLGMDKNGLLIMESCVNKNEYQLVKLLPVWSLERLLWIGKLKEDPTNCKLANLPNELVAEIATYLKSHQSKRPKKSSHEPYKLDRYKKFRY